ncbi:MAG: Holliday junction resolvase RuvX [Oscillospiraceae bacterium]|nr:Holliday junction resolvase RuvX [Oscillospiraceae bacterium]
MRIMAVDYGDARTGIAVSDLTATICGEALTIEEHDMRNAARRIALTAAEKNVSRIVLGLPLNMDGTEGPRAEKSREFAKLLTDESGLEVLFRDERKTTVDAHRILSENGKRMKKHKKNVDAVAAALILESYLREPKR